MLLLHLNMTPQCICIVAVFNYIIAYNVSTKPLLFSVYRVNQLMRSSFIFSFIFIVHYVILFQPHLVDKIIHFWIYPKNLVIFILDFRISIIFECLININEIIFMKLLRDEYVLVTI